jgi:PPOX class probable F420-dependent enzyme
MPTPPLPRELQEVLAKPNPSVIGTVAPDGAPNTVATWYVWEDGRVLVNMDEERRRLEYLRSNPRVSLTVLDGDEWYRHISLHGTTPISSTSTASPRTTRASRTASATAAA